ncbi:acyltransferase family protein [Allocoleopsis franciscana PCC 7113]|uniref:Acyltransferase family protein n=2 Tax=Allocoleopsis TaxID=2886347 RepID=K9W9N7_9CYAN|nr:acyltransferase family protein [Allocoleopsis franciscana PCC 7113]
MAVVLINPRKVEIRAMPQINHPVVKDLANLYFEAKRLFHQWRYPNVSMAPGVKIKGSLVVNGTVKVTIGPGSRLGKRVLFYGSGTVTIGSNVSLNGPWIGCERSITIGDECLISDCAIADSDYHNLEPHLRHCPPGPKVSAPIVIERNVWIGARATVMKGVTIGADSAVGLGCVVRKSVPPGVVVIGNPQQIVKHFDLEQPLKESVHLAH